MCVVCDTRVFVLSHGTRNARCGTAEIAELHGQVAQLSQRDRAAVWVSCGPNINIVFRIHYSKNIAVDCCCSYAC